MYTIGNLELIENDLYQHFFRLSEIKERYDKGELDLKQGYVKYPSRYIIFCLSLCRTAHLYIDGGKKKWVMLDGNKRLKTLIDFTENRFQLYNGMYFKDLEFFLQSRLRDYEMVSFVLSSTSKENRMRIIKFIKELE